MARFVSIKIFVLLLFCLVLIEIHNSEAFFHRCPSKAKRPPKHVRALTKQVQCSNPRCIGQCKVCHKTQCRPGSAKGRYAAPPRMKPYFSSKPQNWVEAYKRQEEELWREENACYQPELMLNHKEHDLDLECYHPELMLNHKDNNLNQQLSDRSICHCQFEGCKAFREALEAEKHKNKRISGTGSNGSPENVGGLYPVQSAQRDDIYAAETEIIKFNSVTNFKNRFAPQLVSDRIFGDEGPLHPTLRCVRCNLDITSDETAVIVQCFGCKKILPGEFPEETDEEKMASTRQRRRTTVLHPILLVPQPEIEIAQEETTRRSRLSDSKTGLRDKTESRVEWADKLIKEEIPGPSIRASEETLKDFLKIVEDSDSSHGSSKTEAQSKIVITSETYPENSDDEDTTVGSKDTPDALMVFSKKKNKKNSKKSGNPS